MVIIWVFQNELSSQKVQDSPTTQNRAFHNWPKPATKSLGDGWDKTHTKSQQMGKKQKWLKQVEKDLKEAELTTFWKREMAREKQ